MDNNTKRSIDKGDFFQVYEDVFVGNELIERRGRLYVIPMEYGLDPHDPDDFGTRAVWLPKQKKFKE